MADIYEHISSIKNDTGGDDNGLGRQRRHLSSSDDDDGGKNCVTVQYYLASEDQTDADSTLLTGSGFFYLPSDELMFTYPLYESKSARDSNSDDPIGYVQGRYLVLPSGPFAFGCILADRYHFPGLGDFNIQFSCAPSGPALLSANGVYEGARTATFSEIQLDEGLPEGLPLSKLATYELCGDLVNVSSDD